MIRIAIVEDDKKQIELIISFLKQYEIENSNVSFETKFFYTSSSFIGHYKQNFDIILMDIELPDGNGMETAKSVRKLDSNVTIIFVTNMSQYAIKGYSVGALDYMVKPINYYSFSTMLTRAISKCSMEKEDIHLIYTNNGIVKISLRDISYIEVYDHRLSYHTSEGIFEEWGKLSALEEKLTKKGFARGNNCYLINLRKVKKIDGNEVYLNDEKLQLSRARRKDFLRLFADYISGESKTNV